MEQKVIHYPSLKTVLMVEKVLRDTDLAISRAELKRRLPKGIMHQTLNLILSFLEERGMIVDTHKGIVWIYNPSPKIKTAIERGVEV
jgi:response regulator of citrate/malate metabolism